VNVATLRVVSRLVAPALIPSVEDNLSVSVPAAIGSLKVTVGFTDSETLDEPGIGVTDVTTGAVVSGGREMSKTGETQ
jgi:hypothetical protein